MLGIIKNNTRANARDSVIRNEKAFKRMGYGSSKTKYNKSKETGDLA